MIVASDRDRDDRGQPSNRTPALELSARSRTYGGGSSDALETLRDSTGVRVRSAQRLSRCPGVIRGRACLKRSRISDSRRTSASRARTHSALLPCRPAAVTRPHDGHSATRRDGKGSVLSTVESRESNRLAVEKARFFRPTCQRWRTCRLEFKTRPWRLETRRAQLGPAVAWRHSARG